MIDRASILELMSESPTAWFSVDDLAEVLDPDGLDPDATLQIRGLLPQVHVDIMRPPPWEHLLDHSEPAAIECPEDLVVWHLASSATAADYSRILVACLQRAQATSQRSESRHWLQRAQEALTAMATRYQG